MYVDAELLFAEDQDLAQIAGTYASTNVIDMRAEGSRDGNNKGGLAVVVTETFASGGAATRVPASGRAAVGSAPGALCIAFGRRAVASRVPFSLLGGVL